MVVWLIKEIGFFLSLLVSKWREALGVTELLFSASGGELTGPRIGKPETTLEGRRRWRCSRSIQNGRRHSFFVGWCFFPLNHTQLASSSSYSKWKKKRKKRQWRKSRLAEVFLDYEWKPDLIQWLICECWCATAHTATRRSIYTRWFLMDDGSEMAGCAVGGRTKNCVSSFSLLNNNRKLPRWIESLIEPASLPPRENSSIYLGGKICETPKNLKHPSEYYQERKKARLIKRTL